MGLPGRSRGILGVVYSIMLLFVFLTDGFQGRQQHYWSNLAYDMVVCIVPPASSRSACVQASFCRRVVQATSRFASPVLLALIAIAIRCLCRCQCSASVGRSYLFAATHPSVQE